MRGRAIKAVAAALAASGLAPQAAWAWGTAIALPVAPDGPGGGPWEIKEWPLHGCTECRATPADEALYGQIRDALLSPGSAIDAGLPTLDVRILTLAHGLATEQRERGSTFAELRTLVQGCVHGSEGLLRPNAKSRPGTSYGLRLDCDGKATSRWLSVTITPERQVRIYYLPAEPIYVEALGTNDR